MKRKNTSLDISLNTLFIILSFLCIFPILLVIGISLSSTDTIAKNGYMLIPREFSLDGYKHVFGSNNSIFSAYLVTLFTTVVGTVIGVIISSMYAYPIARKDFKHKNFFSFYIFFTMLFSGGLVASYMINTTVLHLSNTVWALILPPLISAWNVLILKNFFKTSVPDAIIESAKIDGASEYRILFQLVFPISLPGIATIALFMVLNYWNDWWYPLLYITNPKLYNLQFLLQNMMANIEQLSSGNTGAGSEVMLLFETPADSARMALCVVAMGPILIVYPFFQKYFIQGLTVGAVKG